MTATAGYYADLAAALGCEVCAEEPLSRWTTMRVGGPAAFLFFPRQEDQAARLWAGLAEGPLPVRILGWGSNVIVADEGVRAAVISTLKLRRDPQRGAGDTVEALAGTPVPGLARWAARRGLAGLEFAEGIPAHLGGAVRMNAGANQSCFGAITASLLVAGRTGAVDEHPVAPEDFGYRESPAARNGWFVIGARLRLHPGDPAEIQRRMKLFREKRRASQPVTAHSAGCVFTNYSDTPVGRLVEELGLKGLRRGGAQVSPVHGNFIVNTGEASAGDVLALIEVVGRALAEAKGVPPRLEVDIWRDPR